MKESSNPTVLIVEDETALADLFASWLSTDYQVRTAYTGEQAFNQLDNSIDVALLDRRLPDSSGDDILDEIRNRDIDCRVAMVSAVDPDFDVMEMGFDDYLTKPVLADDLREKVGELLDLSTFDKQFQEFYSLAQKKAALETTKRPSELQENEEYSSLKRQFNQTKQRVEETMQEYDTTEFRALMDDL